MPSFSTTSRALLLTGAASLAIAPAAFAQTGITVYNDGRVLVRRPLPVAVPKGTSTQRVELGPVDPSSLVSLDQGVVINRALFDAAEDENAVLRRLVGRKLTVERGKQGGGTETFQVTLLGVDPSRFLMPDGTVAFGNPGGALRYPADAVSTTQAATLTLTSASGRKDLPLGWFTDGAQWRASYDVILGAKDARLTGNAVISSQTFSATDAEVQLLAGSVSRAAPAPAAYEMRDRVAMKSMNAAAPMAPPAEEGAGGFHLYTLPGQGHDPARQHHHHRAVRPGEYGLREAPGRPRPAAVVRLRAAAAGRADGAGRDDLHPQARPQDPLRRQAAARWHGADLQPRQRWPAAAGRARRRSATAPRARMSRSTPATPSTSRRSGCRPNTRRCRRSGAT